MRKQAEWIRFPKGLEVSCPKLVSGVGWRKSGLPVAAAGDAAAKVAATKAKPTMIVFIIAMAVLYNERTVEETVWPNVCDIQCKETRSRFSYLCGRTWEVFSPHKRVTQV